MASSTKIRPGTRWSVIVPALLTAALLGVGCGSDEVTEEDYRAQTGEVCAKYEKVIEADQKQVARLASRSGTEPEPFVEVVRRFQRDWDRFVAELKVVERPPAAREETDRFFAALTASQDRIADLARAVDQLPGLVADVKAVQRSQDPAEAQALTEKATRIQAEVQQTEAGFDRSISKIDRITRQYPGLAGCR